MDRQILKRLEGVNNWVKAAVIFGMVVIILCLLAISASAAAGTTSVSISCPAVVSAGTSFSVSINVLTDKEIAGAQFTLSFNPALVRVTNVAEGNFLKQNGVSTYFTPGQINNTSGTLSGVGGVIMAPGQSVSTAGTLAVITMTAAGSIKGTSALTLSNVILGNVAGQSVTAATTNGQVSVDRAPVLTFTGNKTVNYNSLLNFTISASDADADSLTYSASNLPAGAVFSPSTRIFSWTPFATQAGIYSNVRFQVTDGLLTTFENITITVNKLTPIFSNLSAPSIIYGTTPASLGGTLKSGALIPIGSVSITLNGVTQTSAIDASGNFSSSFITSALAAAGSPYKISYDYAGNTSFNTVADTTKTLVVNPKAATVSLSNLNQIYDGTPRSAGVATSPSGLSVALTYNGSASAPSAAGTYVVAGTITSANYSGSATGTLVITKVTAIPSIITPIYNSAAGISGTAEAGASVVLSVNGKAQPAVTASSTGGAWSVSGLTLAVGNTISVTAKGTGATVSPAATATVTASALTATLTSLKSSANPALFSQPVTFTATVNSGTARPAGTVTFKDGTSVLSTVTLNTASQATYTTSALTVNTHNISAVYNGNTTWAANSVTLTQTVNKVSTVTTLKSSISPSVFGRSVTFTASVAALSPGTATPSGTIYFKDGAIILGTAALSGSGQAAYTISALSVGNHIISVEYPGTTSFAVSAASLTQTINKASTATALQSSLISSTYGKAVIFSAAVSALSPGSGTPTGTVTFKDGAKILATINLSSGKAALSMTSLSRGTHIITAVYNGDGNFIVNLSNSVSQVIK